MSLTSSFISEPPMLDGKFDESMWQASGGEQAAKQPIRMGFDNRYVYIGIRDAFPGLAKSSMTTERTRDSDLSDSVRIRLEIDIDRDLQTSFDLEIDPSGRCRDMCNGFVQWNPLWFIGIDNSGDHWNAEIAIRRADLFSMPIVPGDAWRTRRNAG